MPFSWVRRIDRCGSWNELPVTLELRASPLAAIGYFFVVTMLSISMLLPIGAAAGSEWLSATQTIPTAARIQVMIAGMLAAAACGWFGYCGYRSIASRPRVTIRETLVEVRHAGLFSTHLTRTPLDAFLGLIVLPRTTLGGRSAGLYLLHADRSMSPLIAQGTTIDPAEVETISRALRMPILTSLTIPAVKPAIAEAAPVAQNDAAATPLPVAA